MDKELNYDLAKLSSNAKIEQERNRMRHHQEFIKRQKIKQIKRREKNKEILLGIGKMTIYALTIATAIVLGVAYLRAAIVLKNHPGRRQVGSDPQDGSPVYAYMVDEKIVNDSSMMSKEFKNQLDQMLDFEEKFKSYDESR